MSDIPHEDDGGEIGFRNVDEEAPHNEQGEQGDGPAPEPSDEEDPSEA